MSKKAHPTSASTELNTHQHPNQLERYQEWLVGTASKTVNYISRAIARPEPDNLTRILTWNCQGAYRKKAEHIAALQPAIAVIQECEPLHKLAFPKGTPLPSVAAWYGEGKKGIGVFSYTNYSFELYEGYDSSIHHCVPLRVCGEKIFHLLAVWTKTDPARQWCYLGQIHRALEQYKEFLGAHDSFIIGDFNWNAIWRHYNPAVTQQGVMDAIDRAGMISYYHKYFREPFGSELQNTFFMYRHANRGFHIDYCFGPTSWLPHLHRVRLGEKASWLQRSDHLPLIADLTIPGSDSPAARHC